MGEPCGCHVGIAFGYASAPDDDCTFELFGPGGCRIPRDMGFEMKGRRRTKLKCPLWRPLTEGLRP